MCFYDLSVRVEGLEPPSLAALDPKSSVSTNFTTPAIFFFGKGSKGKDYSPKSANFFYQKCKYNFIEFTSFAILMYIIEVKPKKT